MKFDFTDRASYLAWRAKWRDDYKVLATDITRQKKARKMFLRTYERRPTENGVIRVLVSKEPNPNHADTPKLFSMRAAAAYQMVLLQEAKELSWQMKQARLSAADAA